MARSRASLLGTALFVLFAFAFSAGACCAQQGSGQPSQWNNQTAGTSDLYRTPMRASEPGANQNPSQNYPAFGGSQSANRNTGTNLPASGTSRGGVPIGWVRPAGYQPPSVQSFPPVQSAPPFSPPGAAAQPFGGVPPGSFGGQGGFNGVPPQVNQPQVGGFVPGQPQPFAGQRFSGQQFPNQTFVPNNAPQAFGPPLAQPQPGFQPGFQTSPSDFNNLLAPGALAGPGNPNAFSAAPGAVPQPLAPGERIAPIDVYLQERRSGRIMLGGTVNSELGVAGQIVLEERNFDWREWTPGPNLFLGGGQLLRIELTPGNEVQRYSVNWTQPNLFGNLPYSLSLGGFYYTRELRNWDEQRGGGRIQLGTEITRNLSFSSELRMEDVIIFRPSQAGVADLDAALGSNDVYRARFKLAHDTRDSPFLARQGSLLELVFDQVFGEYDFSRGQINWSNHRIVGSDRADPSARLQTLSSFVRLGVTGSQTPIFENFYAGGLSSLRGFDFRGASPRDMDVEVGGEFMLLGGLEYGFSITPDDSYRGVLFADAGTVERDITITSDDIRLSLGAGLRLSVPALGPAPLALDFAYPVLMADTDDRQIFSFYLGATR